MDKITFDQLPQAVSLLLERVGHLMAKIEEVLEKMPQQENGNGRLMPLGQVSSLLGKSTSTIYAMTSEKRIPYRKRGNKLYFFEVEIMRLNKAARLARQTKMNLKHGLKPYAATRNASLAL